MATAAPHGITEIVYEWEGRDHGGRLVRGELRAAGEHQAQATLRRRGVLLTRIKKRRPRLGRAVRPRDIALFTRQLAAMLKAGVPLLQAFDVVERGSASPALAQLINGVRVAVETGTSLSAAFRRYPAHFDDLYCHLVEAGETAGALETLLERLAEYMEKTQAIKARIKSALAYPAAVMAVAFAVVAAIMVLVIPAFRDTFSAFGADLPAPTLFVIGLSGFFVRWWWLVLGGLGASAYAFVRARQRSPRARLLFDRLALKIPVFGALAEKSCVARWTRTLSTMFAAGVPLVEALESVGGATGSLIYAGATGKIRQDIATGTSLTAAMTRAGVFPPMVLQMCAIGEEAGAIDAMLSRAADFYEAEADELVARLSSLMEPAIIVLLGAVIGGIVISMYLPIFKLGQIV